jgi:hypothetical protein
MPETIKISKSFLEKILKSANKMSESCVLKLDTNGIYTVCTSADTGVILYARCNFSNVASSIKRINIISIKRFLSGLDCLGKENEFSIEYENNNIKCSNKTGDNEFTEFKYYLVDDSIIRECGMDINKIANLNFDTEFVIPFSKIKQIMQGYAFASDVSKIYFYSENLEIYSEINDRTLQNVDNIKIKLSDSFIGDPMHTPVPINTEVFKNLSNTKSDIRVRFNKDFKVFIFQNKNTDDVDLKYIVSALVK